MEGMLPSQTWHSQSEEIVAHAGRGGRCIIQQALVEANVVWQVKHRHSMVFNFSSLLSYQ